MYAFRMNRVLVGGILALTVVLTVSCNSNNPPPTPIRPLQANAERLYENDLPLARSVVHIHFNREFKPVTLRALNTAFQLKLPEDSPLTGHSLGEMPIENIEVVSSQTIEITVGSLIANGSTLQVMAKALSGSDEELTITISSEFTELGVVLAGGVFGFDDLSVVAPRQVEEPTAVDRDSNVVRAELQDHLEDRQASVTVRETVLALYDGMAEEIVPAPKLRAALAALAGTFADAAVRSLLSPENCTGTRAAFIGFQKPPGEAELIARVTYDDNGRRILSIRPDLEAAPFELLIPLVAHEAIHCDQVDSLEEEIVASAIDVFLYIHLLLSKPELAFDTSPLARNFNIEALAMLNSGRKTPEALGILPSPHGREVLPESGVMHRSFADLIASSYFGETNSSAPVEPVAQEYLDTLAQAIGMSLGSAIDLNYVDSLLGHATTFEAIANMLEIFELSPR